MGEFPLDSQEFVIYTDLEKCREMARELISILDNYYEKGKIEGFFFSVIENYDDALDEDLYVDEENEQYPFLWVNITYRKDNAPLEEIESIREKYNLERC